MFLTNTARLFFAYQPAWGKNRQGEIELNRTDILSVKVPQQCPTKKEQNEQWKGMAEEAAREIRERRKPIEDAIVEKWDALHHLDQYSHVLEAVYRKGPSPGSFEPVFRRDEFMGIREIQEDVKKEIQKERAKLKKRI